MERCDNPWVKKPLIFLVIFVTIFMFSAGAMAENGAEGTLSLTDLVFLFPNQVKEEKFQIDKDMEKAIANIRVAILKKINSFETLTLIDQKINQETNFYLKKGN